MPVVCCTADREGRYTAVVMTWGPGQGTAMHDHGGLWCVEGVVEGAMTVTQYHDVVDQPDGSSAPRGGPGPAQRRRERRSSHSTN